jgi:hypothetical protein
MTWQVQVREPGRACDYSVHLGHPSRPLDTDQPGIYVAAHQHAIMAEHFPVGAADVWADGIVAWRLVCTPRRKPLTDDVMSAFDCHEDPPSWELGGVTCSACRRWAHVVRRHRHASEVVRAEAIA